MDLTNPTNETSEREADMSDEGFKRKITAILSAEAVEYSRLMKV
jgi:hypothetical protein